ncbi:putative damage-inducible protein DinB [Paenibacillus phyllosphaerae]|uniref:Putative damage-inducible protein DinB n=1 Tax=Paenibacillus phyllosphaerae TaxID=274593 RepID=A0A7W5FMY0_9BACL|nr:DinB family protein [Paenibacillus phyllosphaerae]MBB3110608.1 putative damage-inducible protein DinB [Paenibacillus phyllosphaerae]
MFTSIASFEASWLHETQGTQRVMDALTDESLKQTIAPNHRPLGQLAWHITTSIHEMLSRTGLTFPAAGEDEKAPASAAVIAEAYRTSSAAVLAAVKEQWTDETLLKTANMYGDEWPNGLTLHILIMHEVHHRGQMTVLMRQAGLRVPGLYGPSREEWIEQGMEPLL